MTGSRNKTSKSAVSVERRLGRCSALGVLLQDSAVSSRRALGYLGEDEAKNCLIRGIIYKGDENCSFPADIYDYQIFHPFIEVLPFAHSLH